MTPQIDILCGKPNEDELGVILALWEAYQQIEPPSTDPHYSRWQLFTRLQKILPKWRLCSTPWQHSRQSNDSWLI